MYIIKNFTMNKKNRTNIIGDGKDGIIVDNITCDQFTLKNGYVAKKFKKKMKFNHLLHNKLREIDPESKRYNWYILPPMHCDLKNIVFQKKLKSVDLKKLTKKQYRYLRKSIEILHTNNIIHGDLPNNVMIDIYDEMPRIIDWENAKLNADNIEKQIDFYAFFTHFKVLKK